MLPPLPLLPTILKSRTSVWPGGAAGDLMAWRATPSFGPRAGGGRRIGSHVYWSERPPGALRLAHFRRLTGGGDDDGGSGDDGHGGGGSAAVELVYDENAAAAASGAAWRYSLASLDASPAGDWLAVTERTAAGAPATLRVLPLGDGGASGSGGVEGLSVASPVVWACPGAQGEAAASVEAAAGGRASEQRRRLLLYLTADEAEVRAITFPAPGSSPSQPPPPPPPGGALVYRDPRGAGARLWRGAATRISSGSGDGGDGGAWAVFVAGLGPDGCPMEVTCLPPGATATGADGWLEVLPGGGPSARLAVAAWGGWLLAQRWEPARCPGGELLAARLPGATGAGDAGLEWRLLHTAPLGWRHEGLLLPPLPASCAADSGGPLPGNALMLCWRPHPDNPDAEEQLVALPLRLDASGGSGGDAAATGAVGEPLPIPLPSPSCVLHAAGWWPAESTPGGAGGQVPTAAAPRLEGATLQLVFSSLARPPTRLVLDLERRCAALRLVGGAAAGHDAGAFEVRATAAVAPDGAMVPVTLAWHGEARAALEAALRDGDGDSSSGSSGVNGSGAPVVLFAYGSFGLPERECAFDAARVLLMRLGFVVAVAHVRGGGWRGAAWAEAGRGAERKRRVAVSDLAAVADALVARQGRVAAAAASSSGGVGSSSSSSSYPARKRLALAGSSAAGWLIGCALADRPGLAAAAVLTVPCLDPLGALVRHGHSSMEWAPPHAGAATSDPEAAAVEALAAWSPYQRLAALAAASGDSDGDSDSRSCNGGDLAGAPHLLLRAALHDADVGFADAAKVAAALRRLRSEAAAATASSVAGLGGGAGGTEHRREPLLLLRSVPGGHGAFEGDGREDALAAAFLAEALGCGPALARAFGGTDGNFEELTWGPPPK